MNSYPPGDFYFQLQFGDVRIPADNAFQEATGLVAELEIEAIKEGRQADKHRVPQSPQSGNLVLRRGFMSANSPLATWVGATINTDFTKPIQTIDVLLSLLNGQHVALATWQFREAWPVKLSMSDFRSQDNAQAIETLEFAYSEFQHLEGVRIWANPKENEPVSSERSS
ncbi:phage tail protein [Hymenobacter artigasi]|uniref:Phage tail-like protein n=1 Tax=Hymenobacter artigasi TaxID=2719616 RepID=A0ABX1HNH9_9BACT|nr:phage tail protein [Hymenobacter artigasi]NKI91818.1 phage tail-like protein [Hymenobacter artigasi]